MNSDKLQPVTTEQARRHQGLWLTAALKRMAVCEQQQATSSCCKLEGFDDPQLAFSAKSTGQLVQSLAIFRTCSVKPLVQNADVLLAAAKKVIGPTVVNSVVRHTFFKHFCGGELHCTYLPSLCAESVWFVDALQEEQTVMPPCTLDSHDCLCGFAVDAEQDMCAASCKSITCCYCVLIVSR